LDVAVDAPIQAVFAHLAHDQPRTGMIAAAIREQFGQGRKVLVLIERTDHLERLQKTLVESVEPVSVLHGRLAEKSRAEQFAPLDALGEDVPRVILAIGKLVGEGFDHLALETLVLALPVAWKGTLQRYASRLHRGHSGKPKYG
jgi:superfamily II DNA or RNA helicase